MAVKLFVRTESGHRYTEAEDSSVMYAAAAILQKRNVPSLSDILSGMGHLMRGEELDAMRLVKEREKEAQVNP